MGKVLLLYCQPFFSRSFLFNVSYCLILLQLSLWKHTLVILFGTVTCPGINRAAFSRILEMVKKKSLIHLSAPCWNLTGALDGSVEAAQEPGPDLLSPFQRWVGIGRGELSGYVHNWESDGQILLVLCALYTVKMCLSSALAGSPTLSNESSRCPVLQSHRRSNTEYNVS